MNAFPLYHLFSFYIKTLKVATSYTFYQLVYGMHPLMLTKYILQIICGDHKVANLIRILTSRFFDLEKL
jgi:hypothetical protein